MKWLKYFLIYSNKKMVDYKVFYKTEDNRYRVYDGKKCKTVDEYPKAFEQAKGYSKNKKGLKKYYIDLGKEAQKLRDHGFRFNYLVFGSHKRAILRIFNYYLPSKYQMRKGKQWFKEIPNTDYKEFMMQKACFNSGLIFGQKGTFKNVVAIDRHSYFPHILGHKSGDFHIPICKPRYETLKELPIAKDLKYGIYRVKITCPNKEVLKFFSFSKDHTYTHFDIGTAQYLSTQYDDFKLELINTPDNAMIYDETIRSTYFFGDWFENVVQFKKNKKLKGNTLCKQLLNVWGRICQQRNEVKKSASIDDINLWSDEEQSKYEFFHSHDETFEYVHKDNWYNINIGRLKPFLLAISRRRLFDTLFKNKEKVIRVYVDGIIFTSDMKYRQSATMKFDSKYNGKDITIESANKVIVHN